MTMMESDIGTEAMTEPTKGKVEPRSGDLELASRPGTCAVCGNRYDNMLRVESGGKHAFFDCFECAMHAMAPLCAQCGVRVIGHGVQAGDALFCCAHCARQRGVAALKDRA